MCFRHFELVISTLATAAAGGGAAAAAVVVPATVCSVSQSINYDAYVCTYLTSFLVLFYSPPSCPALEKIRSDEMIRD